MRLIILDRDTSAYPPKEVEYHAALVEEIHPKEIDRLRQLLDDDTRWACVHKMMGIARIDIDFWSIAVWLAGKHQDGKLPC